MTYFRMRMHTIIGANSFHGPVRDGKGWVQAAMAAKHKRCEGRVTGGCDTDPVIRPSNTAALGYNAIKKEEVIWVLIVKPLKVIGSSLTGN